MHCYVERQAYKSNEFIEIYRVWQEKVKILTWKLKNLKKLKTYLFKIFRFY